MIHKTIKKIHHYRLLFLFVSSLAFLTFLGTNPIDLGKYYGAQFGSAVGMSVGIPENPVNKVARQLKEKEDSLNQWESALEAREGALNKKPKSDQFIIYLMGSGIVVLFLLIIINFYLDKRHRKKNGN
jgi:hypothetical protein